MADPSERTVANQGQSLSDRYERPRVEQVLTPVDLEREVLYAGPPATPPP